MNEKLIQEAIDNYRKKINGMSVIVIAHRLTTIKDADKIIVLKDGVLTEQGNHQELLSNYPNGTYAEFVEKQKNADADVEEGDANEDEGEIDPKPASEADLSKASVNKSGSTLKTKKSIKRNPKEDAMHEECDARDKER